MTKRTLLASLISLFILLTVTASTAAYPELVPNEPAWTVVASLNTARFANTATLLPNGQVLIVGGSDGTNVFTDAEGV